MRRRTYPSLADYLRQTGTTQAEFGERVGLNQSQVSKILNGRIRPSLALALQIADSARVPVESLLHRRAS